jgi:hypothetical protein
MAFLPRSKTINTDANPLVTRNNENRQLKDDKTRNMKAGSVFESALLTANNRQGVTRAFGKDIMN